MHVTLGDKAFANYNARVTAVIEKCQERIQWLRQGSRELFGTLLEDKVSKMCLESAGNSYCRTLEDTGKL